MNALALIHKLLDRRALTKPEAHALFTAIMKGELTPVHLSAVLSAMRVKGETIDELHGAAEAMREAAVPVRCDKRPLVDTCGTGGDGKSIFNVSTAAAFVVAGAGYTVAKHGNRSVSSSCGSADVLQALGVPMTETAEIAQTCLEKTGIAFLYAPAFHPAMTHAAPVRKELGTRTIFNLLGPLTNPAKPTVQLLGVYDPVWLKPVAETLKRLGSESACVVHGQGEDEISLAGSTDVAELIGGTIKTETWRPEDFGFKSQPREEPTTKNPHEYSRAFLEVLNGRQGYLRNSLCMNAAAAIRAAARTKNGGAKNLSLKDAVVIAQRSIDTRAAIGKYEALKQILTPNEDARV